MDNNRTAQDRELNMVNNNFRGMNSRIYERSLFEKCTRFDRDEDKVRNQQHSDKNRVGEITGEEVETSPFTYGMPLRSAYTGKKIQKDYIPTARSDFDLFDENKRQNFDVSYDDQSNPMTSTFSVISSNNEKIIPEIYGTDAGSFVTSNINKFSIDFFNILKNQSDENFCISPYGLYCLFSVLYFASTGTSESDIYDFFSMVSKDNIIEGINYIQKLYDDPQFYNQIIFRNIILMDNSLPVNDNYIKYIHPIVSVYPICVKQGDIEARSFNQFLYKLSNGMIHPISNKIFGKTDITMLNIGLIKPIWKKPFDTSFDGKFISIKNKIVRMLGQIDSEYEYFEDNLSQMIEIPCLGNFMSMGIILPKDLLAPSVTFDEINVMIKNLKRTNINELHIPAFTQQVKIKLSNLLYQSGLRSVFFKLSCPELVKQETKISDVLQNITIIIANNPNINDKMNKPTKTANAQISNIKFIANHPFIYYFRILATNTILFMGYFCS